MPPILSALAETPHLPEEIFPHLPKPLRRLYPLYQQKSDLDVWVASGLGVLSGCLPQVRGLYHQMRYAPNLFVVITAPAGSGKSIVGQARRFGEGIDDLFQERHEQQKREAAERKEAGGLDGEGGDPVREKEIPPPADHEEAKVDFQETGADLAPEAQPGKKYQKRTRKPKPSQEAEATPARVRPFISGDISSAALVTRLQQNGGFGIVVETEIDTILKAQKQEWGGTSDIFRKAHGHENVGQDRIETGPKDVKDPRLSVVLAGTPSQFIRLISSPEDGLFSRFCFVAFLPEDPLAWKDPRPRRDLPDPDLLFKTSSEEVRQVWTVLEARKTPLYVTLRDDQWDYLNEKMTGAMEKLFEAFNYNGKGVAHRLGLHIFRLAMILTVWRAWEQEVNLSEAETLETSDESFRAAMKLGEFFVNHARALMSTYPREVMKPLTEKEKAFFDGLAEEFETAQAIEVAGLFEIPERTVYRHLDTWVKLGYLRKVQRGQYRKPGAPTGKKET